jgi:anti-sigma regulatory factor (Ser/Thr protein kinase)
MQTDSNFSLTLPYRIKLGQALGADKHEALQLRLAAEEVFSYIMAAFPASEKNAVFYLRCQEGNGNIKFSFSNHGTPINVRATPEFAVTDIESTIEGLGLSLVKQVTDGFECINCGQDGWLIVFSKRLSAFRSVLRQPELSTEPVLEP